MKNVSRLRKEAGSRENLECKTIIANSHPKDNIENSILNQKSAPNYFKAKATPFAIHSLSEPTEAEKSFAIRRNIS